MKAFVADQDYTIVLELANQELSRVKERELVAQLHDSLRDIPFDKQLRLKYGECDQPDGIELNYLPEDHKGWDDITGILVTVNERALSYVEQRGFFGTRYGLGDKIEIFNGEPHAL